MAKQRKDSNVVDMIEPAPEGFNVSREVWASTPECVRSEIIRAHRELSECIPIDKDRRAGRAHRGKRVKGGWYELHCCERDATPESLARAAELREILAPEIALQALNDDLAEYHAMAEAGGTTVAKALRQYVAVEQRLREDPEAEIIAIMKNLAVDPIEWARRQLQTNSEEVA
ncbi:hypothetical protein [Bradyrhizobium sp. RDM4]|uniref:hypothetical protein n=1 Tax=Bradyrhizobium sp. RDM4 TaxID=3378765 RepID=UPI0038FC686C